MSLNENSISVAFFVFLFYNKSHFKGEDYMAKATIIIPVYNKEKYLKETLTSVDKQTVDDLEVIIIDDFSTDHSLDIVRDFASSTKKEVRIFKNDKNQGVAYSRNIGIQEAKADYTTFLDADDTLDVNYIEIMLDKIKRNPYVDFVRGIIRIFEDGKVIVDGRIKSYYEEQIIVPKMNPKYIQQESISSNGRLYNSNFIKNLRFVESGYEDYEFSLDTILSCTSILYTSQAVYNYNVVDDGKSAIEMKNFLKTFNDYEAIYDRVLEKHIDISESMLENLKKRQLHLYINYLHDIKSSDMKLTDRMNLIKYCLIYFKHKYGISDLDILKYFGIPVCLDYDMQESQHKIKEILMKY